MGKLSRNGTILAGKFEFVRAIGEKGYGRSRCYLWNSFGIFEYVVLMVPVK